MQFGMPSLAEDRSLFYTAILCRELKLDFIELNMNLPPYQLESLEQIRYFEDVASRYGIYYTIHLDENLNVCDFNTKVAQAYLDTVQGAIRIAKKLEIPLLNFHLHPGVYFTLPQGRLYLFEQHRDWYLQKLKQFRSLCEREIGGLPIQISVENTDGFLPFQQEGVEFLLESPVFCLTWDVGHSHRAGGVDEPFLLQHQTRLGHFHLHDATDKQDHLILGSGEVHIQEKLKIAAEQNCRCVIETKTADGLRKSVYWLNRHGHIF